MTEQTVVTTDSALEMLISDNVTHSGVRTHLMMLRPKLSLKLLSMPTTIFSICTQGNHAHLTLKVLSETVEKSTAVDGVVEADVGKQNAFEKTCEDISEDQPHQ